MGLPWARPRHEVLLLALVGIVALSPLYPVNDGQDVSRLCLTRSLIHLKVSGDDCLVAPLAVDRSRRAGHLYSDKAPGLSLLEVPAAAAVSLPLPSSWPDESVRLWVVRALSVGLAFLASAFLVGRVSEGLAPGYGGVSMVGFALGTLAAPFAVANFDHVPAGTLDLAAFLLAWARRPVLAGLVAGAALLTEYESGAVLVLVGIYIALQGARPLGRYVLGLLPGLLLLGAYDWAAFGAPWHLSYRYLDNEYAARQSAGFFGIHVPHLHSAWLVTGGSQGLLVVSPIVVACVYGLFLLGRRYRAEAILCAAVGVAFFLVDSGYFAPYGGLSPGPRFLVPSLPVPRARARAGVRPPVPGRARPRSAVDRLDDGADADLDEGHELSRDRLGRDRTAPRHPRRLAAGPRARQERRVRGRGARTALRPSWSRRSPSGRSRSQPVRPAG